MQGVSMSDRKTLIPEGWHAVTPRILVNNAGQLVDFVKDVFSATGDYRPDVPAIVSIGDSIIMISDADVRATTPAFLYVEEPADMPYGDRRGMVEDKWGNTWQIATYRSHIL
jgi:PhnB protein